MNLEQAATILSFLLILGGFVAIVFPFAPSIPTIWFGIFLYAISHQYIAVNQSFMVLVSVIALGTIILDYTLSRAGAQKLMAGPWGVMGAVLGGLLGTFFGPVATYIIGPLTGAMVAELLHGRDRVYSYKAGEYTIIAFMGGTVIKLLAGIIMVGLFILRLQGKW